MNHKKVELLAPAGSYTGMVLAFDAGADAVYLGGAKFGARAYAQNFDTEELLRAIDYAHLRGKKLYLTVNTLMKEEEIEHDLIPYLKAPYEQGLDAVIVQDVGVISRIRDAFPDLAIHASTQMSITSIHGIRVMERSGVSRVVPARELSLNEIRAITAQTDTELECFVHGAMCFCYSGQCLMSSLIGGRSGNRGRCAQPCRLPYEWMGKTQYPLSLKDLCTIDIIPSLVEAGIASFKIEGRMKKPEYTAGVTSIYRKYLDLYESGRPYQVSAADRDLLQRLYTRSGSETGYYFRHNSDEMKTLQKPSYNSDTDAVPALDSCKRKLNGELILFTGKPAKLTVSCDNLKVTVTGEPAEIAQTASLNEEQVRKHLDKTGNTPFVFDRLTIRMGNDLYYSVKSLKDLRRSALEEMENEILSKFRRTFNNNEKSDSPVLIEPEPCPEELTVLVSTKEQLDEVNSWEEVRTVYVEYDLRKELVKVPGKQYYLALPYVIREEPDLTGADGLLVRSIDGLDLIGTKEAVSDAGLYSWNTYAEQWLLKQGIKRTTIPYELNLKEIRQRGMCASEEITYGYIPLMITAQCLKGETLKDRTGSEFRTEQHCDSCYNIIYNREPLYHADEPVCRTTRWNFTNESAEEMRRIRNGDIPEHYTRGHLKRGVQ